MFGQGRSRTVWAQDTEARLQIRDQLDLVYELRNVLRTDLQNVRWYQLGKGPQLEETAAQVQRQMIDLEVELKAREDAYRKLFHERDATAADAAVTQALPQARQREVQRTKKLFDEAAAKVALLQAQSAPEHAEALEEAMAALRAYQDALDEVARLATATTRSP
jgi:hypothetical protein